jgi:hypothetical protein
LYQNRNLRQENGFGGGIAAVLGQWGESIIFWLIFSAKKIGFYPLWRSIDHPTLTRFLKTPA